MYTEKKTTCRNRIISEIPLATNGISLVDGRIFFLAQTLAQTFENILKRKENWKKCCIPLFKNFFWLVHCAHIKMSGKIFFLIFFAFQVICNRLNMKKNSASYKRNSAFFQCMFSQKVTCKWPLGLFLCTSAKIPKGLKGRT